MYTAYGDFLTDLASQGGQLLDQAVPGASATVEQAAKAAGIPVSTQPAAPAQPVSAPAQPVAAPVAPRVQFARPASQMLRASRALRPSAVPQATPSAPPGMMPQGPAPVSPDGVVTASMEAGEDSNTMLYVGLGVAVLALGGIAYFLTSKKKAV